MPKGALHAHSAALIHYMTGKYVMDFHPDDIFWCTANPGWVTGTSYGIISPLLHGITNIVDESDFDAMRWCQILASQKVTVWYTAPTAIRRFMRMGVEPLRDYDLSHPRLIHSFGEPLNPEAVVWGLMAMGLPIHKTRPARSCGVYSRPASWAFPKATSRHWRTQNNRIKDCLIYRCIHFQISRMPAAVTIWRGH